MIDEKDTFEKEMTLLELLCIMQPHPKLHVWNVKYTDKNGDVHYVRYTTATRDEAIRLFRSEQDHGDVIKSVRKVKNNDV